MSDILKKYLARVSKENHDEGGENTDIVEDTVVEEVVEEAEVEVPEPVEGITPIEVEESQVEADEVIEEDRETEAEIAETEIIESQAEQEVASIEEYMTILRHGIKTKTYSPQFAAACQLKLNKLAETTGINNVASLEDFGGEELDKFYEKSLESFTGVVKVIGDAVKKATSYLPDLVRSGVLVKRYVTRAANVHTQADAVLEMANEMDAKASVSTSVPKSLSGEGTLLANVAADLKMTSASVTKGLKANEKLVDGLANVLQKVSTETSGKVEPIIAEAVKVAPAVDAYPSEAYSKGFLGGSKLEAVPLAEEAEGNTAKIKVLAKGAIPKVRSEKTGEKGEVTLTLAEVKKLLNMAKVYAELGKKSAESSGVGAIERFKKIRLSGANNRSIGRTSTVTMSEGWQIGKLVDASGTILSDHVKVYRFLTDHALTVAEQLVALAKRAVVGATSAKKDEGENEE